VSHLVLLSREELVPLEHFMYRLGQARRRDSMLHTEERSQDWWCLAKTYAGARPARKQGSSVLLAWAWNTTWAVPGV